MNLCSLDPITSIWALKLLYSGNFCIILLPCPAPEPHQPPQDYCSSQPASLPAACLTSPPVSCTYPHLINFPHFSQCASAVSCRCLWMSQTRRLEVQTGLRLCACNFALTVTSNGFMPLSCWKIPTPRPQRSLGITSSKCLSNLQELLRFLSPWTYNSQGTHRTFLHLFVYMFTISTNL